MGGSLSGCQISRRRRRRLINEQLERRDLLANDLPFQNPIQRFDVNQDLMISASDALFIINRLTPDSGLNPLPENNDSAGFPDVNGSQTLTALDALQVVNQLRSTTPLLSGRLTNDSAPDGMTNFDFITNSYALELGISSDDVSAGEIEGRINAGPADPFVNLTDRLDAGVMELSESEINQLAGVDLPDGEHRFEFRVVGQTSVQAFSVTIDRGAPMVEVLVNDTVRETFGQLDIASNEPLGTDVQMADLFELTVAGGPNDGQIIPVEQVDRLTGGITRVGFDQELADQGYSFSVAAAISDLAGNETIVPATLFTVADPPGIDELSPTAGERFVSVNRETIIRFDEPVDPDSITGGGNTLVVTEAPATAPGAPPIQVIAGGVRLGGRLVVSSTQRFATFFYDNPLPESTEVRIVIDGDVIMGQDGLPLDADGDREPGGQRRSEFRTLSMTPVAGTGVFGFLRDSSTNEPIVGATIRVDNMPEKNVVTDSTGRFELTDLPAPEVFVVLDGSTATNLPAGFIYPSVAKPFETTAGQLVQLNHDGIAFDAFLPRLSVSDIETLSSTEITEVGLGDDGKQRLESIFPDADPTLFDLFSLTIQPGAAVDDLGNPATQAAIIPVEPDRIPAPLPTFLNPELVVSIQVPGATNFDVPAEITFPNLEGLAPGEKSQIFSFDHDQGEWRLVGTGTVSADGRSIVSDGGVIQAPGWHNTQGGANVDSDGEGNTEEDMDDEPSVSISGPNRIFDGSGTDTAQISIINTSDVSVTINVEYDNVSSVAETSFNRTSLTLEPRARQTIELTGREVTDPLIESLQTGNDPSVVHSQIRTASIRIEAPDVTVETPEGEVPLEETFLYGLVLAPNGELGFPVPLEEQPDPDGTVPVETEQQTIELEVTGPVSQLDFSPPNGPIDFQASSGGGTFQVPTTVLLDSSPSGQLTLSSGEDSLPAINVNPSETLDLSPFAIRRISGEISGSIEDLEFSINGAVEVGLATSGESSFVPLFTIDGSFAVNQNMLRLSGKLTTDLLETVTGFELPGIVLAEGTVFEINRNTREFSFPVTPPDLGAAIPDELTFTVAGLTFSLTDVFIPEDQSGLGLRGSVTLPEQLGGVKVEVGSAGDNSGGVVISTTGVQVLGGTIDFPDVTFHLFGVQAEATSLSLEYRSAEFTGGEQRGDRLFLRGDLVLVFPSFSPDLRIAASFANSEGDPGEMPEPLIDLDSALGRAWQLATERVDGLAEFDEEGDQAPDPLEQPDDSFILIEDLPNNGGLGVEAVGAIQIGAAEGSRSGIPILNTGVVINTALLTIDTVNDNYVGLARIETPLRQAGEITGLIGFRGGEFDLIAFGLGGFNNGLGIPITGTPLFLNSIGGGVRDLSVPNPPPMNQNVLNQVLGEADVIAAVTATAGPATPQLFPGFTLPSFLGGASFPAGDLLRIDAGGNIGAEGLTLGGQVVIGGDETGGLIEGNAEVDLNLREGSVRIAAGLDAIDGLVTIAGLGDEPLATVTVNSDLDISANGRATATLPQSLPFPLRWASGVALGSAEATFQINNDGDSSNDYLAFWGTVPLFVNPFTDELVTATAGLQVYFSLRFPNFITSTEEAAQVAGGGEGESTGQMVFEVPTGEPFALFSTEWENSLPTARVELIDPSGSVIPEDQFESNPNVFLLSTSENSRDVAVNAPDAGNWTVRVVDSAQNDLGTIQFATLLDAPLPTIDVASVAVDAGSQLTITYDTTQTDQNAQVSLFLDDDRNLFDGALLAEGITLENDGSGTTTIDLSALDLPSGDYFVYAQLDQPGKPIALSEYFVAGFDVVNPNALGAVQDIQARWIGDNQVLVSWDELVDAESYLVQISDDAAGVEFQQSASVDSSVNSVVISDLTFDNPLAMGETYRVSVVGIDAEDRLGSMDSAAIVTVGLTQTVAPLTGQFPVYAVPGDPFTGQVAFNPGDLAELIEGPIGSEVDASTGEFTWNVPVDASGFVDAVIRITPANGITRFDSFRLLASSIPAGQITAQVVDDIDRDGQADAGETGINGVSVELVDPINGDVLATLVSQDIDLDENNSIETETESGIVQFATLNPGDYIIRRADVIGQPQQVALTDAANTTVFLGDRSEALIAGSVLLDEDFDGTGDVPLAGVVVGLDLDDDGVMDRQTVTASDDPTTPGTDETGTYRFANLLAGDVTVTVMPSAGFAAAGVESQVISLAFDQMVNAVDFSVTLDPIGSDPLAQLRVADSSVQVFETIDFGQLLADGAGGQRVTIDLQLANLGGSNLMIESIELADSDAGFSVDGLEAGSTLLPEGFANASSVEAFSVGFDPTNPGDATTTLTIRTNDPSSPLVVELLGSGIVDGPELQVLVPNNNAGGVAVGRSATRMNFFTLSNTGSQDLSISRISGTLGFTPVNLPASFPAQPIVLTAGASIPIDLEVAPSILGLQSGVIEVVSDGVGQSSQTLFLVATGIPQSGPAAQVGGDFVAIETPALDGSPVLRDLSGPNGEFNFIIAPQSAYEVTLFDPLSGLVAKSLDQSTASGETSTVIMPIFLASTAPDSDLDNLPDDIEFAIGTSINSPDTDGDGINDFAEVSQGLDPLSGLLVGTGIVAATALFGQANAVVLASSPDDPNAQLAYLATGSHGLAIVDVADPLSPIVLGQLDLPGNALDVDVDLTLGVAAVASDGGGLHVIDISDPLFPILQETAVVGAQRVEVFGGVGYVTAGNSLLSIDLATATTLDLTTAGQFTDVVREGNFLYTMEQENVLRVFELDGLSFEARGTLTLDQGAGRLFVGDQVVYAAAEDFFLGGFSTVDVSDPLTPLLISGSDVVDPNIAPGQVVVPTGSDLGLVLGDPGVGPVIDLVDLSDLSNTEIFADTFRARIPLPSQSFDVAVGGGMGFVAAGESGLQIINYLAFDDQQAPPQVQLDLLNDDADPLAEGIQIIEGSRLRVSVDATDDVQVRKVDLLIDGAVVGSDLSFPFETNSLAPMLASGAPSTGFTLQVRAIDTGGNVGVSDLQTIEVIEDAISPTIDLITPADTSLLTPGLVPINIRFSEAVTMESVTPGNFTLTGSPDVAIEPLSVLLSPDQTEARFTYQLATPDNYEFVINTANVMDLGGNPIGGSPVITSYLIEDNNVSSLALFGEQRLLLDSPIDSVVGDFSSDGIPDLAVITNNNSAPGVDHVAVMLGNADGTFGDPTDFAIEQNPTRIRSADLNGDRVLDLIVVGTGTNASVLLGMGDGTFAPRTLVDLGTTVTDLVVAQVDGSDGIDLLALSSSFGVSDVNFLAGNGDGSFQAAIRSNLGAIGIANRLAIGDFDGDLNVDVAAAGNGVSVAFGSGDGTFGNDFVIGGVSGEIAIVDVNGDDNDDLVTGNLFTQVSVILGNGNGGFGAATQVPVEGTRRGFAAQDFDGDGNVDLATLSQVGTLSKIGILVGAGDGSFADPTFFDLASTPTRLSAGDVNGDGNADLITANGTPGGVGRVSLLLGSGDGSLQAVTRFDAGFDPSVPSVLSGPRGITTGDFNGDMIPDLVTANPISNDVSFLAGTGDGALATQVKFATGTRPVAIVSADFNGDGDLDVVTANETDANLSILLGDGSGSFGAPMAFPLESAPVSVAAADLNGDDVVDLVLGRGAGGISLLLGVGDGTFNGSTPFDSGTNGTTHDVALVDIDGDNDLDIVTASGSLVAFGGAIVRLAGNGDGTFSAASEIASVGGARRVGIDDFNGDGLLDIVAASVVPATLTEELVILLGQSGGGFADPVSISVEQLNPNALVTTGDVNGDGAVDLLAQSGNEAVVLLGQGDGTFADPLRFGTGDADNLLVVDLNGDGGLDIVTANESTRDVSVLINQSSASLPLSGGGEGESLGDGLDVNLVDSLLSHEDSWLD